MLLNLFASSRGYHSLLPVPETAKSKFEDGDAFCRCMKQAGIGRIAFLRHGKTGPSEDGVDFNRILTDEGRGQVMISGATFGKEDLPPFFPSVLVSPAPRTVETAEIFLTYAGVRNSVELKAVSQAYDGTMQPEGSELFKKIGYAPLSDYVNNQNDEKDRATAQRVLGQYSFSIADVLYQTAAEVPSLDADEQDSSSTLLFVGHAIYLPAAALGVASLAQCDPDSQEMILSSITNEAEGYLVDLRGKSARYLGKSL